MGIKFRITHHAKALPAHRFRYQIRHTNGNEMLSGEGYPTYQHAVRAVRGLLKGMAKALGVAAAKEVSDTLRIPFTADSYKPKQ